MHLIVLQFNTLYGIALQILKYTSRKEQGGRVRHSYSILLQWFVQSCSAIHWTTSYGYSRDGSMIWFFSPYLNHNSMQQRILFFLWRNLCTFVKNMEASYDLGFERILLIIVFHCLQKICKSRSRLLIMFYPFTSILQHTCITEQKEKLSMFITIYNDMFSFFVTFLSFTCVCSLNYP